MSCSTVCQINISNDFDSRCQAGRGIHVYGVERVLANVRNCLSLQENRADNVCNRNKIRRRRWRRKLRMIFILLLIRPIYSLY